MKNENNEVWDNFVMWWLRYGPTLNVVAIIVVIFLMIVLYATYG